MSDIGLIRYVLVGFFLLVLIYTLVFQNNQIVRAWKKIAYIFILLLACGAVLWPEAVAWIAIQLGVGRGSDLVFYFTTAVVIALVMQTYIKFRHFEHRIGILAQHIAILESRYEELKENKEQLEKKNL